MSLSSHPATHGLRRTLFVIGMLALSNLACFTIQQTIIYDSSGDGSGVVLLEMTLPQDLGDSGMSFENAGDLKAGLEEQGWVDVSVSELDAAHYIATGRFLFGTEVTGNVLSDVITGYELIVEEAENGYKYYTFTGEANYTDIENFWKNVTNDYAVNGIKTTADTFGLGASETKIEISAEEVQRMISAYGPPSATIRVVLPGQTPVEAGQFWLNEDAFLAGQTDMVEFTWKPGDRAKVPLKVVRRLEPLTIVTPEEAQANLGALIGHYVQVIPSGKNPIIKWWSGPLAGHINNNLTAYFSGDNYICSDYQRRIMNWLDQIRASPNEEVRNLLKGLDYGPIETQGGGHRAVVVFPRGTDWRTSGTVFDPWPYQEPRAFPISTWNQFLWGVSDEAKWPYPDSDSGKYYPHLTGGTSSYPASAEIQGDLGKGLTKPVRILMVRSPVSVLLTYGDGRRIGTLPDGTLINELGSGANFYSLPKDDGSSEYETYMFLPEGEFTVTMNGIGTGEFHALLATPDGISGYGPQPIAAGQTATFTNDALGQPSTLTMPDGSSVQPMALAGDQLDTAMGIPLDATVSVPEIETGQGGEPVTLPEANLPGGLTMQTLMWGGLVCLGLVGLAVFGGGTLVLGNIFMKGRKPGTPAAAATRKPLAQAPAQVEAHLMIDGPGGAKEFLLQMTPVTIGRTHENGLALPSPSISRQHASIAFEKGRYVVRDLGSANGVMVNGRKINGPVKLSTGDVIEIQPYTLTFKEK